MVRAATQPTNENNKMGEGQQGAHESRRQAIRRKVQRRHDRFYKHRSHWSFANADEAAPQAIHWHRERWILAATVALMTLLSAVAIPGWANAMKRVAPPPPHTVMPLSLPALSPQSGDTKPTPWKQVRVHSGQTLSDIFQSLGLGFSDVQRTLDAADQSSVLRNIHPGDTFAFQIGKHGQLEALRFELAVLASLERERAGIGRATSELQSRGRLVCRVLLGRTK